MGLVVRKIFMLNAKKKKENHLQMYSNLFVKELKRLLRQFEAVWRKANRKIHRRRINNGNQYLLRK